MDSNSLLIAGNSYFDIVVTNQKHVASGSNSRGEIQLALGGVFNISRALVELEIKHGIYTLVGSPINKENLWQFAQYGSTLNLEDFLDVKVRFDSEFMCRAIINQDIEGASRTSIVKNGVGRNLQPLIGSSFSHQHISYIDNLPNFSAFSLSQMRQDGQFISVDLCLNDPSESEIDLTLGKIEKVDLVIMSESEFEGLFLKKCSLKSVESITNSIENLIVHGEGRIIIRTQDILEEVPGTRKDVTKVLGLGDRFISYFYASFLDDIDIVFAARTAFWQLQKEVWSK